MVRGKKRELPRKNVNVDVNAAIHNRFDVEVVDAATGQVKKKARAYNVICFQLWSRLFTPDTYFNYIHYGTGEGSPTQSDSKLFHFSGYLQPKTADDMYNFDMENYTYSLTRKVQINPEVAVGETITEVGIAYDKTEGTLCTHAMLEDMNGNPISIEKTGTDLINIYATVYLHLPNNFENPAAWFIIQDPVPNFISLILGLRPSSYYTPNMCQLNQSANPRGMSCVSQGKFSVSAQSEYNLPERKIVIKADRFQVDVGNTEFGANGVYLATRTWDESNTSRYGVVTILCDKFFEKSNVVGEAVGTGDGSSLDFATKFEFPENATIKVNGAPVDASVKNVPLAYEDMGRYFLPLKSTGSHLARLTTFGGSEGPARSYSNCETLYFNPFYKYGIKNFNLTYGKDDVFLYASQNGTEWSENLVKQQGVNTIPEEFKNAKYWRVVKDSGYEHYGVSKMTADTLTGKNIHFTEPPAEGAVITADYTTPVIAKDDQHVFDLTVTLSFNPYEAT